jgi:hypothetical protein
MFLKIPVTASRGAKHMGLPAVLQFHAFPLGKIDPANRILDHHIIDAGIAGAIPGRSLKGSHQPRFACPVSQVGDDDQ